MNPLLKDKRIAILMADGFEESEFTEPRQALEAENATITVITPGGEKVRSWKDGDWGGTFSADLSLSEARSEQFDGLVLPGGVLNPDTLRTNSKAIEFISNFIVDQKPIAAICHAPLLLSETGMIKGFRMTSIGAIKTDLINAGVEWLDEPVVEDHHIVSSRSPKDLPAFNSRMLDAFSEGRVPHRTSTEAMV